MENFHLGQLTKELVSARLRAMDDPCAAAAGIVGAAISVALRSMPADRSAWPAAVKDACQGGITGLLLAEQNLARGAVLILARICEVAQERQMDPTEAMMSALRGIADLKRFVLPGRMEELRAAVDAEFMGAGEFLRKLLAESNANAPTGS